VLQIYPVLATASEHTRSDGAESNITAVTTGCNFSGQMTTWWQPICQARRQKKKRLAAEASAKEYIYKTTPQKYHDFIVPDFPLGCKRRIFDPNYLESLHSQNLNLVAEGIKEFDETGIVSESGVREEFDVIVLATGFQVQNFLTPMEIVGKTGSSLEDQWASGIGKSTSLFIGLLLTI